MCGRVEEIPRHEHRCQKHAPARCHSVIWPGCYCFRNNLGYSYSTLPRAVCDGVLPSPHNLAFHPKPWSSDNHQWQLWWMCVVLVAATGSVCFQERWLTQNEVFKEFRKQGRISWMTGFNPLSCKYLTLYLVNNCTYLATKSEVTVLFTIKLC